MYIDTAVAQGMVTLLTALEDLTPSLNSLDENFGIEDGELSFGVYLGEDAVTCTYTASRQKWSITS